MKIEEILERMDSGKIYYSNDPHLLEIQVRTQDLLFAYNHTPPSQGEQRTALLKKMLAEYGEGSYIEPPFHANWGGSHVHLGREVYANVYLSLVDDGPIYIGDHAMIGPHVTICTGTHPICPELREHQAQYNLPVHIGRNVWIGGHSFVMPGVTIGENSVIGAGSLVTRDIPANVVAAGSPCRVLRPITQEDRKFYNHGQVIDLSIP